MKKVFTKYLFFVFLLPILVFIVAYFFGTKTEGEIKTWGVNRTINFGGIDIDAILSNPIYTISFFYSSYAIYLLGYFIVFPSSKKYKPFLLANKSHSIWNKLFFTCY